MKALDKVIAALPKEGKFTADELAVDLGFPIHYGFQHKSPKTTRYLLQCCKMGLLVQWFISNGSKHDTTDCCPVFTCYYIPVGSKVYNDVLSGRNRQLRGHRII